MIVIVTCLYVNLSVTRNRKIEMSKGFFSSIAIASEIRRRIYAVNTNYTEHIRLFTLAASHSLNTCIGYCLY